MKSNGDKIILKKTPEKNPVFLGRLWFFYQNMTPLSGSIVSFSFWWVHMFTLSFGSSVMALTKLGLTSDPLSRKVRRYHGVWSQKIFPRLLIPNNFYHFARTPNPKHGEICKFLAGNKFSFFKLCTLSLLFDWIVDFILFSSVLFT